MPDTNPIETDYHNTWTHPPEKSLLITWKWGHSITVDPYPTSEAWSEQEIAFVLDEVRRVYPEDDEEDE